MKRNTQKNLLLKKKNKLIAVIWEDIEEYKNPGFAVDLDDYLKGVEKVHTVEELCRIVEDVVNNENRL